MSAKASNAKQFGHQLRSNRLTADLTLSALADRLKVTKGYLSRVEQGKAIPSASMIERMAKVMGVDSEPLLILAGYLPADVQHILHSHPIEAPTVLREAFGGYIVDERPRQSQPAERDTGKTTAIKKPGNLYQLVQGDCFEWLDQRAPHSIQAVVTDPPYGLKE